MLKDNQDRVDAYLRNEMSDEERKAFEHDLVEDEQLREDYELTKAISKALADREAKIEQIRLWEKKEQIKDEFTNRQEAAAKPKIFRKWIITFSAAASLLVGFFAIRSVYVTYEAHNVDCAPSFGDSYSYRGNINIAPLDSLIRNEDYEKAMLMTDSLTTVCESAIESISSKAELTDKDNYKILEQNHMLYVLTWRRINLLLALDKEKEAFEILKSFKDDDGAYKKDANLLYDKLNVKLSE